MRGPRRARTMTGRHGHGLVIGKFYPFHLYPMKQALKARATVGEVCNTLRDVWGSYVPADTF